MKASRAKLRDYTQLESKSAKGQLVIQWIVQLPLLKLNPPLLDAGFGVGCGFLCGRHQEFFTSFLYI